MAMMSNRFPRNRQGFTLVEVLIALVVLSFGLLSLGAFQTSVIRDSAVAKERTEAVNLARAQLERYRTNSGNVADGQQDAIAGSSANFTRDTSIVDTAAGFGVQVSPEEISALKARGEANNDWEVTRRLLATVSRSVRNALMIFFDLECFTRQLISQSLQPRQ